MANQEKQIITDFAPHAARPGSYKMRKYRIVPALNKGRRTYEVEVRGFHIPFIFTRWHYVDFFYDLDEARSVVDFLTRSV